jgi:methylmalonyl-CoA/ethylmalonyl-CoA epimerase
MLGGLDHLAVVVSDTEEALEVWRDRFGFPVLFSEVVNGETVKLTHLDLGNTHLQLVEPLVEDAPLMSWLKENGAGLHHLCIKVDDVVLASEEMQDAGLEPGEPQPREGSQGQRALFLDPESTGGVRVEITGR